MKIIYLGTIIELIRGDITKITADAIVNAANSSLAGGGGVDGAIHRAAGRVIAEQCRKIVKKQGGCKTGEAVYTDAGNLDAKYIIHTVGPIYRGAASDETQLSSAYTNSLMLAKKLGARTIAFPSISTGIYRFPIKKASLIALKAIKRFVEENRETFKKITLVLFSEYDFNIYKMAVATVFDS